MIDYVALEGDEEAKGRMGSLREEWRGDGRMEGRKKRQV